MGRAETQFRSAFERLKAGKPQLLPRGSRVSQNNVAREAGVKPSALRSKRFPVLTEEIERWIKANEHQAIPETPRQKILVQRARNRGLKEQLADLILQRDDAISKLTIAEARIVDLTMELLMLRARLPPSNVTSLRGAGSPQG